MEIIFLRRSDLLVKDFAYVDHDYQIIIDSVIPQKSSFVANKQNINAEVGDLLVVKDKVINYIGIIVSIEEDTQKFNSKIQTTDFISILDIQIKLKSYSGNISIYLMNLIKNAYIDNSDPKQKIKYLSIDRDFADINGTLNYEADTIGTISSVVETLNKAYSIGVFYSLDYYGGKINGITLHISNCTKGVILKSNLSAISDLVISSDNTQTTNKIMFIPSDENVTHKNVVCFYLLQDGTISSDASSSLRYSTICSVSKIYKDADYSTLSTTAQSEMLASSLEHSITFNLRFDNQVVVPFKDINVGDFIKFITPNKTYQTMITQIAIKNTLTAAGITLGEYRGSLTDKIKLLSKK